MYHKRLADQDFQSSRDRHKNHVCALCTTRFFDQGSQTSRKAVVLEVTGVGSRVKFDLA